MRLILAILAVMGLLLSPLGASAHMARVAAQGEAASMVQSMSPSMAGMDMPAATSADKDHACCDDQAAPSNGGGKTPTDKQDGKAGFSDCAKTCLACNATPVALPSLVAAPTSAARLARAAWPLLQEAAAGQVASGLDRPPRLIT